MADEGAGLFRALTARASAGGTLSGGVPGFAPLTASAQAADPIALRALTASSGNDKGNALLRALTAISTGINPIDIAFAPLTASASDVNVAYGTSSFLELTASAIESAKSPMAAMRASGNDNLHATVAASFAPLTATGSGLAVPAFAPLTVSASDANVGGGAALFRPMTAVAAERATIQFAPLTASASAARGIASFLPLTARYDANEMFAGWAINLDTNAVSRYDSLAANSFCQWNGVTYLANVSGVHAYGADDDAGQPIRAAFMLPNTDYGSEVRKRIHDVYLAGKTPETVKRLRMYVATDNAPDGYYYPVTPRTGHMRSSHVKFGQGLKGRYWQIGMTNINGADFEFDALSFTPIPLNQRGA